MIKVKGHQYWWLEVLVVTTWKVCNEDDGIMECDFLGGRQFLMGSCVVVLFNLTNENKV